MNVRVISVGIVAILAMAGASVALLHMNDGDDTQHSICDTWYATYEETIDLKTYGIESDHYLMGMRMMPLVIEGADSGFLKGTWDGKAFQAVMLGDTFSFDCFGYGTFDEVGCYIEAKHVDDRILFTVVLYDGDYASTVGGAYIQYTRQGKIPVDLIDMADFSGTYIPTHRGVYTEDSIVEGEDILPSTCPSISLSKSGDMINVFTTSNGITMAVISNGYDGNGCATGLAIGIGVFDESEHYLCGSIVMGDDRFVLCYHLDLSYESIYAARLEYRVECDQGRSVEPVIEEGTYEVEAFGILQDGKIDTMRFTVTVTVYGSGVNLAFRDQAGELAMSFIGCMKMDTMQGIMSTPGGSGYFVSYIDGEGISMSGFAYSIGYNIPFHCRITF